ncbi:MAG: hypothetical protein C0404_09045 [Verrucomicrobia bacterium]|nr:hypothetical protein [Verrucomicrobiota bacterium]
MMKGYGRGTAGIGLSMAVFLVAAFSADRCPGATNLSDSFLLSTNAPWGPQYYPDTAYASNGAVWLAVWHQGIPTGDGTGMAAQDIYAARIRSDGTVLDPAGIAICANTDFQTRPHVAADGNGFLVVWQDLRSGSSWDVYAARITTNGIVQDPGGFVISGAAGTNECLPDVAFGGGNYCVAWLDARHYPEYRVYGARVTPAGTIIDTGGTELIRTISNADRAAWATKPLAPGKLGSGWYEVARQPCAPTVESDGIEFFVTSYASVYGHGGASLESKMKYYYCTLDGASGLITRPATNYPKLESGITSPTAGNQDNPHARLQHAAIDTNRFLSAVFYSDAGFGGAGPGSWYTALFSPGSTNSQVREIYYDSVQSAVGYRTSGRSPNGVGMAWDGRRGLFVCDRFLHKTATAPGATRTGDIDIMGTVIENPDGSGTNATVLAIANGLNTEANAAVSAGPVGRFLVLWQEQRDVTNSWIAGRFVDVE